VSFIRAALVPVAVVAVGVLAAGCGPTSGTTTAGDPASIANRVTTSPVPAATPKPSPASPAAPTATSPKVNAPKATAKSRAEIPTTTSKEVVEFRTIPFKKKTVTDDSLAKGSKEIRTTGVNGTRRLTYRVSFVNGVQTAKKMIKQEIAKQPRTQVTAVGTKVEKPAKSSGCDPNYTGCVPIASDVDCSGGSGNGPEYVDGPVEVIGTDIYRLDADHDGIGCE
jgi:hypothetical protein